MATALAATFQAGTTTDPARVLLAVTGAPSQTVSYASTFTTTDDGWTGSGGTFVLNPTEGAAANTLELQGAAGVTSTFSRTVTGLTIGQTYAYTLMATPTFGGTVAIGVTGIGATSFRHLTARAPMAYSFTATATSHVITVLTKGPNIGLGGSFILDTVKVTKTSGWLGTTIRRTDANGTSVVVREAIAGQDTTGTTGSATMSVTDYEAALTGTVSYTVTDGTGVTATATVTPPATAGVWLTLPAVSDPAVPTPPAFVPVVMVTSYDEDSASNGSLHWVINRADPIANPGPLQLRSGSVDLWCTDYPTAKAVRTLLAGGAVAQLRQPSFPGLDLYLVATGGVGIRHETLTTPQRWVATVTFQEVTAP